MRGAAYVGNFFPTMRLTVKEVQLCYAHFQADPEKGGRNIKNISMH